MTFSIFHSKTHPGIKVAGLKTPLPVVQWLRLQAPNAGGLGLITGQGTRSHTPQLRVCMPQLKDPTCCN